MIVRLSAVVQLLLSFVVHIFLINLLHDHIRTPLQSSAYENNFTSYLLSHTQRFHLSVLHRITRLQLTPEISASFTCALRLVTVTGTTLSISLCVRSRERKSHAHSHPYKYKNLHSFMKTHLCKHSCTHTHKHTHKKHEQV